MLPNFRTHLGRYAVAQWIGISLLCLLLVFSLVRNSAVLGIFELLSAGVAIVGGVTYGAFRDAPGYWIYSTLGPKFMLSKEELSEVRGLQFNRVLRWLNPVQSPFGMPLLLIVLVVPLLLAGQMLFPSQQSLLVLVVIGLVFPLLLSGLLLGSARYFLALASPQGEAVLREGLRRPRQARLYRCEDLCISLLITFVLICPLQDKPAFSLVAGYASPEFMVAALLLGWIAAFFILLGARRSRLFSVVGERLSAVFDTEAAQPTPIRSGVALLRRLLAYYGLIALWVLVLCLGFAQLPLKPPFPLFCLLLLPVLGGVFWRERGLTLRRDGREAAQYIEEQAVMPVAVARRSYDANV